MRDSLALLVNALSTSCLQGEVYTWGLNDKAQMGMPSGPGQGSLIPKRMELLVGWDVK